jgi:hypothetical protein
MIKKSVFKFITFAGILFFIFLGSGCKNFFHDLIPPDDNFIVSFSFEGQQGQARIDTDTVRASAEKEIDLTAIIPRITVSHKASIIPLTLDYLQAAFPGINLFRTAMEIFRTENLTDYMTNLIKETPDFNIPVLNMPINFSGPVPFMVISGQGTVRQYTITVSTISDNPQITSFGFSKYDNPEIMHDARINITGQNIIANIVYPAEMDDLSFSLIPSFEFIGDSVSISNQSGLNSEEITNRESYIQFSSVIGTPQTKILTVTQNGEQSVYTLTVIFSLDFDSIRSITDFRFNKNNNQDIAVTVVGSIINSGNFGTITIQVYYTGAQPSLLIPHFISPGTVTVGGSVQNSGTSVHNFSSPLIYRVVSRNGLFSREYTVNTEFISLTNNAPRMLSFRFSQGLNNDLTQDAVGEISDGFIMIDVRYSGFNAPEFLIPEFRAEGIVTVSNSVQVSGSSAHNFSRHIRYTVTNPENPLFTRDYWVNARIIQDAESSAEITSFGFYIEDNTGLEEDLIARIDQSAGKISIIAPIGSGVKSRPIIAQFEAKGQVRTAGIIQSSGATAQIFETPLVYTVTSANGQNVRQYIVDVRELRSPIFVNSSAVGLGDGTSWENAFLNLTAACEAAAMFPDAAQVEIWIAKGTYTPSQTGNIEEFLLLTPNTSYIGGFAGWETNKNQRNVAANETIISGNLGGGVYSYNLFASGFNANDESLVVEGSISFEGLIFQDAKAIRNLNRRRRNFDMLITNEDRVRGNMGAAILARLSLNGNIFITNCIFRNLTSGATSDEIIERSGIAIHILDGNAVVSDTFFYSCNPTAGTTISGRAVGVAYFDCSDEITIQRVSIENSFAGLRLNSNGNINVSHLDLKDIATIGLSVAGRTLTQNQVIIANHTFSNITGDNIGNGDGYSPLQREIIGAINIHRGSGFTLQNSVFHNTRTINLASQARGIYVINTSIINSTSIDISIARSALFISAGGAAGTSGFAAIDRLLIDGFPGNGLRFELRNGSTVQLYNSVIRNGTSNSPASSAISNDNTFGTNNVIEIANTRLENVVTALSPRAINLPATSVNTRFRWSNNWYEGQLLSSQPIIQNLINTGVFVLGGTWEVGN